MEPPQPQPNRTRYVTYATVVSVREEFEHFVSFGPARALVENGTSRGWFVAFEGSHESIHFGEVRPEFEIGDLVRISFEKESP